jgi:hypothetical protein
MDDERTIATGGAWSGLRDHFIGWQCRIRQLAVRRNSGQPMAGMRPRVLDRAGRELSPGIVTLLMKEDPVASTDAFRHAFKRTQDPRERYAKVLEMLAGTYFQKPREFIDEMTALFARESPLAERLIAFGECVLDFEQFSQGYLIPCRVEDLAGDDIAYQATYWHNSLFNPAIPPNPRVLAFSPVWSEAKATAGAP